MVDILQEAGAAFLGSRLKRLGERMQASAARLVIDAGLPIQPGHIPLLAALDGCALTVGQLVDAVGISQPGVTRSVGQLARLGLVTVQQGGDQRQRSISLTPAGISALARVKLYVWPQVEGAVHALIGDDTDSFLHQIADVETALSAKPLHLLAAQTNSNALTIHGFSDELAHHFRAINEEWINAMFTLESADRELLDNPRAVIESGGDILFVEARGLGIVGTCALKKTGGTSFELTKMGVLESARGLKAGEFVLAATIARAMQLGADPLYLLTNARCEAAIHLYEKLGFRHDPAIMADYGARYQRCDVAMRYAPGADAPPRAELVAEPPSS